MDADDVDGVLDRFQTQGDITDITPDAINEFLRNSRATESYWQENKRGKLVDRHRPTKGWSSKKDEIAQEIGKISRLYADAEDYKKIDDVSKEFETWKSNYTLTNSNLKMMQERLDVSDNVDKAVEIVGERNTAKASEVKRLFDSVSTDTGRDYIAAQINNEWIYARNSPLKEAFRNKDIESLERIRDSVKGSGIPFEKVIVNNAEDYISRLRR